MRAKVVVSEGSATKVYVGADKFEVTKQNAVLHTSDGQVRKFALSLDPTQAPYSPGEYEIGDVSLTVSKYGGLEFIRNLVLVPFVRQAQVSPTRQAG